MDFLARLQSRTATLAIGASTLRNQGAPGMVGAARAYLARIDLREFAVRTSRRFEEALDDHTQRLMQSLPRGGRKNWGAARKSLNIFLRDVAYSRLLCDHYDVARIEAWLELPLDSYSHAGLVGDSNGRALPKWPGVKHLTPDLNRELQVAASEIAERLGTLRVHLDVIYWRAKAVDGIA